MGEHMLGEQLVAALGRLGVGPLMRLDEDRAEPAARLVDQVLDQVDRGVPTTAAPVLLSSVTSSAAGASGKIGRAATSRKYRA